MCSHEPACALPAAATSYRRTRKHHLLPRIILCLPKWTTVAEALAEYVAWELFASLLHKVEDWSSRKSLGSTHGCLINDVTSSGESEIFIDRSWCLMAPASMTSSCLLQARVQFYQDVSESRGSFLGAAPPTKASQLHPSRYRAAHSLNGLRRNSAVRAQASSQPSRDQEELQDDAAREIMEEIASEDAQAAEQSRGKQVVQDLFPQAEAARLSPRQQRERQAKLTGRPLRSARAARQPSKRTLDLLGGSRCFPPGIAVTACLTTRQKPGWTWHRRPQCARCAVHKQSGSHICECTTT